MVPLPVITYAHYRRVVQRYIEPESTCTATRRRGATCSGTSRRAGSRARQALFALVDDDDAVAPQARRARRRGVARAQWDLEALGEPEQALKVE